MTRLAVLAWLVVAAVSLAAVTVTGRRAFASHTQAVKTLDGLEIVTRQARELVTLRASDVNPIRRPAAGLAPAVSASLSRCGLPASCLTSVSPEAETVIAGPDSQVRYKRQRATLVLTSLTLPQLGSFLDVWRWDQPEWTVTDIDISPLAAASANPTGGDLPLRAVLSLEAISGEERATGPDIRKTGGAK